MKVIDISKLISIPLLLKVNATILGFIFNLYAARLLSSVEYGLFALCLLLIIVFACICRFGLDQSVVRFLSTSYADKEELKQRRTFWLAVSIASVGLVIMGFLVSIGLDELIAEALEKKQITPLAFKCLLTAIPVCLLSIISSTYRAFRSSNLAVLFSGSVTLSLSLLGMWLFQPKSAIELLNIYMFSGYMALIFALVHCSLKFKLSFSLPSKEITNQLLFSSKSLWIVALTALIIQQGSSIILGKYVTLSELAIFTVCFKIATLMSFLLFALNTVYSPRIAVLYHENNLNGLRELLRAINKLALIFSLIIFASIVVLGEYILGFFGSEYESGYSILVVLALGNSVNVVTGLVVTTMVMSGYELLHKRIAISCAILTLLLSFILIPQFGLLGAAITISVSMATQNIVSYFIVKFKILKTNKNKQSPYDIRT
ncbi:oligosaccharide flippase family protein [Alteromonas facilis]|uniref:oligosaccharide flippase family protein n=1 Tax=Alteromonas facilis TaxID=2048004 RepID=UPI000C28DC20|nr:oligosaccharide flippase family protein [Alteromonas facilis]